MLKLKFTEAEKQALHQERFNHPHPRVQKRMEVLWLKSQELPHWQICQLAQVSENTLRAYCRDYKAGGIEKLKEIHFRRPQSELVAYLDTIEAELRVHPPATINEAVERIETLTGIRRSPTQVRVFLKSIGMRCLKVGSVPAKADIEVQENYKKKF